jgi:hypothetical protein
VKKSLVRVRAPGRLYSDFVISGLERGNATIESTVKTGGIKGMGASEGTLIKRYRGDKKGKSVSTKFTGAILSRVTGGSESVNITRVDKGVYWNLDPQNHTYVERPIGLLKKRGFIPGAIKKPRERCVPGCKTLASTGTVKI